MASPKPSESLEPNEPLEQRKKRAQRIVAALRKRYPEADCALIHTTALELLVATILSAQSTDATVNKVSPILFKAYPTAEALARAPREAIEKIVHATGFFRQKAKNIQGACVRIVEDFDGQVPQSIEALTTLPGVARKTANVVLGTFFGMTEGVVVDTHVGRIASRLALTWTSKNSKDAVKIERDLMQVIPKKSWTYLSHALIHHGRQVCAARKADCEHCSLARYCPSAGKV